MEEDQRLLESILDGAEDPRDLPLGLLKDITNDFSKERKIGEGGFGEVYKGVLGERIVAVKRIYINAHTFDDKLFRSEVAILMNINHRNVVQFLGACSGGYHKLIEDGSGELIWANVLERLLCFKYISNGSLDKYISDELRGLEWEARYEIIIGICKGLRYLHKEKSIVHMDLKPKNILLENQDGKYMVPKITDFGLSRSSKHSHTVGQRYGTLEYMAPEYRDNRGKTTQSCDIYSLGLIIIELVTGCKDVPNKDNVLRRWRHRWQKPPTQLQYHQVTRCIDIARDCRNKNPEDRPSILAIIKFLSESESTYGQISPCLDEDDMLRINPLKLRLPSEIKREISCLVELTNDTRNCIIAFNMKLPNRLYNAQPDKGIVRPGSKCILNIIVQAHDISERDHGDKFIVQSMHVEASEGLRDEDIRERMSKNKGRFVDEVDLMVVYDSTKPQENFKSREDATVQAEEVPEVVESCSNMLEIGTECTNFNPTMRPDTRHVMNRLDGRQTMDKYIKTGLITSEQAERAPNKLHQGMPKSPRETSSKNNVIAVIVEEGTNPCNNIGESTANIDKLNKTLLSLNLDIRRCIQFCRIFPKGSKLRSDDLVHLWIAQGFVKTSCATEDMEERARWYIQDLVSISFLEAIGTSSDTDCFIVNDALHDILDKDATKCFRIENARINRGEGWEGDVPRDIEHLLIHHYDGEFIMETIIGLEYLRSLIVYIVEKDTPIEENVIESICKRLPKLRVLAVGFSWEHDPIEQPKESVGQLQYLRYLAFRVTTDCKITLPRTINKLHHIQLIDFGDGDISRFTVAQLVNLLHLCCSIKTLPIFVVSNEQGCELKQLRGLNKLQGRLCIRGLENVKSKGQALQANLTAKEHLTELSLWWDFDNDRRCSREVQSDVLEGLCPPVGLQRLELWYFASCRYPDWMVGKHSGGPKDLQELFLLECSQPVPASELAKAFPHLRVLQLWSCSSDALPANMEHLTSLKELHIGHCKNIRSLPSLPQSLEEFTLRGCNDEFTKSCKTAGDPNWQKIEHIPKKYFR